jgi:hypothetical protein
MVDLPTVNAPVTTSQAPQPRISPQQVAQPYNELAGLLDKTGEALDAVATPLAEQAGYKAVTRDANGQIQVEKAPLFGPALAAYSRAVKIGAHAEGDAEHRRADIAMRQQFHDDPEGYLAAAEEFKKNAVEQYTKAAGPEVGITLGRTIDAQTTQTYKGLLNEKERLDLQRAEGDINKGISSAANDMMVLARGGASSKDFPEFQQASEKWDALTKEKLANPRLAYTQVQANYDRENLNGEIGGQGILYHVDQVQKDQGPNGGRDKALELAHTLLTDPDIKLSATQREKYYNKAVGEIRANDAQRRQDISEIRADATELRTRSALGMKVDPNEINDIADRLQTVGAPAQRASFLAAASRMPLNDDFGRQPIGEQVHQIQAVKGASAAKDAVEFFLGKGYTREQAAGIVGNLVHESGLDPNAVGDRGTSFGLAQHHAERAQALVDFAKERGTSPNDFRTQLEFIDKELHGSEGATLARLQAAQTPEQAAHAFIGYERPKGWTPENPAGGMGYESRLNFARTVFEGGEISVARSPAGALWLAANRGRELDKNAWARTAQIEKDWQSEKIRPSIKEVNDLTDAARATNNWALQDHLAEIVSKIDTAQAVAQLPLPQQSSISADLRQRGAEGQLDAGVAPWMKDLEAKTEAIRKGLKEDAPNTIAANFSDRFKAPPPLDLKNDDQLAAGLRYRGQLAQFGAQNYQEPALSALGKADLAQVQAALQTPNVADKVRIYSMFTATLPEDVLKATLAHLGATGPGAMIEAGAGAMLRDAPEIAQSILRGQQAFKTDKAYLPKGIPFGEEKAEGVSGDAGDFTVALNKKLPPDVFSLVGRTNPSGPYLMMQGMIKARYADLSAQVGDVSGKFNSARLTQAADDVTGGIVSLNGANLIAPARGMNQRQFDTMLGGVKDSELAGVTTAGGNPIDAATLRNSARLEGIGQGRYLVNFSKDATKPPIYAFTGAHTESPRPFVLDLRGRPVPVPTPMSAGEAFNASAQNFVGP